MVNKYISQTINYNLNEIHNNYDNNDALYQKINMNTTKLEIKSNFFENKMNFEQFEHLKKIIFYSSYTLIKLGKFIDMIEDNKPKINNIPINILDIDSNSIKIIKCIECNLSKILNLPSKLEYLNLNINNIKEIKQLPNTLKVLILSKCKLYLNNIKLNNFVLAELEVLKLNSNNLFTIKEFIPQTNKLNNFECSNNNLSELNLLNEYMENLEILKCSLNKLKKIDDLPTKIEILNCSNNLITQLDNLPAKIKILNCSNNSITQLDNLPIYVEILDCSNNLLTKLDFLPELTKLNCSHNYIINLDNLPNSIETLIISSNPIVKLNNLPINLKYFTFINGNFFENKIPNPPIYLEKVIIFNNNIDEINGTFDNIAKLPNVKTIIVTKYHEYKMTANKMTANKTINLIKSHKSKFRKNCHNLQ